MTVLSTPLPSDDLIFLVNGHRDLAAFEISRLATVENIIALLREAGVDHAALKSILDFGCGCGRVLAGWEPYLRPDLELYGVDINPALIEFCKKSIPFAQTRVSRYLPPLQEFVDEQFDFVYAASVFTHLDLDAAKAWAQELRRIIKPGGILMMSFHGSYYDAEVERLAKNGARILKRKGFFVFLHGKSEDTFLGSNYYATFMTSRFANRLLSGFRLLKNYPGITRGPNSFASYQDISVYQRTPPGIWAQLIERWRA